MRNGKKEKNLQHEFYEFIETDSLAPPKGLDTKITRMVVRDLRPSPTFIYGKFTLIEIFAGLLTLTVCPQFGFGFGQHNEFLHSLHSAVTPITFYLICGMLFVSLGAILSGLIFTRDEVRAIGYTKYVCFLTFGILAYLVLLMLGKEAFVLTSLTWILGAFVGNILGFEITWKLRKAMN